MSEPLRGTAEIRNAKGLHARAAAKFCKTVERFDAEVQVARNGTEHVVVSAGAFLTLGRRVRPERAPAAPAAPR